MKLTPKQRRFVDEYLVDLNATQAAIRAGYSKRTAASQGERLLRNVEVARALQGAQAERSKRTEITQDRVLRELAKLAFSDPRKFFREDGTLKHPTELDDDTAAALAQFEVHEELEDTPPEEELEPQLHGGALKRQHAKQATGQVVKIKWVDRLGAVHLAMRHLGLLNDKLTIQRPKVVRRDLTGRKDKGNDE